MAKLLQIKDVPDDVHRTLKTRAAAAGMSLSEYVRRSLEAQTSRPTPEEVYARIKARGPAGLSQPSEEIIREIRGPLPE